MKIADVTARGAMRATIGALLVCSLGGCGASLEELSRHHVWERALCEAERPEERESVRAGIERDQQLAIAIQAVPEDAIRGAAGTEESPLADLVLVRQRTVATPVPLADSHVGVELVIRGRRRAARPLTMDELLARTGESIPGSRTVTGRRMGGGEFLLRLGLGIMTVGLSEVFIRSSGGGGSGSETYTYVDHPSESQIRAAAPEASAIATAARDRDDDRFLVFDLPADRTDRALAFHVVYEGRDEHHAPCVLEEDLVVRLADDLPLEDAIEQRFGARELTLTDLRAMARE